MHNLIQSFSSQGDAFMFFLEIGMTPVMLNIYLKKITLNIAFPAYMFFLGIGMTPVPWILLGEWFVSETRSMAGGISSAMFFLSALISLQVSTLVCPQF